MFRRRLQVPKLLPRPVSASRFGSSCCGGGGADHGRWQQPEGRETGLYLLNSLTGSKDQLIVPDAGRPLTWYSCGPTVYDAAHLGHARNYVCLDILHRVLTSHFMIPVLQVINITDVDDKIVARAAAEGVSAAELTDKWERAFWRDLQRLNVLPPAAWLRVTDHIDLIVEYIQSLVDLGYAYETDDGVYFECNSFDPYGVLDPAVRAGGKPAASDDADDSTAAAAAAAAAGPQAGGGKRDGRDFALWKKVEDIDQLRPGWHIECSALCESVFGPHVDLHTGGIDLAFPHHNNEIAQSEARASGAAADRLADGSYKQWCNYFVHTGHLHIAGRKMSKSLKNFISIEEFIGTNGQGGASEFRMFCLLHKYNSTVHFSDDRMKDAAKVLRRCDQFFSRCNRLLVQPAQPPPPPPTAGAAASGAAQPGAGSAAEPPPTEGFMPVLPASPSGDRWSGQSAKLVELRWGCHVEVNRALADDLDTPAALASILQTMSATNAILDAHEKDLTAQQVAGRAPSVLPAGLAPLVQQLGDTLGMLGLDGIDGRHAAASSSTDGEGRGGKSGSSVDPAEVVEEMLSLRAMLRAKAVSKVGLTVSDLWAVCDQYRDQILPRMGVAVKDRRDGSFSWEYSDRKKPDP